MYFRVMTDILTKTIHICLKNYLQIYLFLFISSVLKIQIKLPLHFLFDVVEKPHAKTLPYVHMQTIQV